MRGGDRRLRSKNGVNAVATQLISMSEGHQSLTAYGVSNRFARISRFPSWCTIPTNQSGGLVGVRRSVRQVQVHMNFRTSSVEEPREDKQIDGPVFPLGHRTSEELMCKFPGSSSCTPDLHPRLHPPLHVYFLMSLWNEDGRGTRHRNVSQSGHTRAVSRRSLQTAPSTNSPNQTARLRIQNHVKAPPTSG